MLRSSVMAALLCLLPWGCAVDETSESADYDVVDVLNTPAERQAIGNCWLYAQASWVESLHLRATGKAFDASQSYWTYWHIYDQLVQKQPDVLDLGGDQARSNRIVLDRGLMAETDFVPEDTNNEMAFRQSTALKRLEKALKEGDLSTKPARGDGKTVRKALDTAFGLAPAVRASLDAAFGADGKRTFAAGNASASGKVIAPSAFAVSYTERRYWWSWKYEIATDLATAIGAWRVEKYPNPTTIASAAKLKVARRNVMIRVQTALHDRQPVVLTWDVDFNALEEREGHSLRGSFNQTALANKGGAGVQGGHMTVVEDYQVYTWDFGLLKAGVTLDATKDAAKLDAALEPDSIIHFLRIKNSWGVLRDDRAFAPGMLGYHDLWMNYLDGPIAWCPEAGEKTGANGEKIKAECKGTSYPLRDVYLPPGY